jgi:prolyl oligopeptidase
MDYLSRRLHDMLRFHKFTDGRFAVTEFGSPDDPDDFEVLRTYSPYHNVRPGAKYPPRW